MCEESYLSHDAEADRMLTVNSTRKLDLDLAYFP
jgi:hypothetical protein